MSLPVKMKFAVIAALLAEFSIIGQVTAAPGQQAPIDAFRVEKIQSDAVSPFGLNDQQVQQVTFTSPVKTSLLTVADRSGSCGQCIPGQPSIYIAAFLPDGSSFDFQLKAGHPDITLSLPQPIPISGLFIRCDAFGNAGACKYTISVVGN